MLVTIMIQDLILSFNAPRFDLSKVRQFLVAEYLHGIYMLPGLLTSRRYSYF